MSAIILKDPNDHELAYWYLYFERKNALHTYYYTTLVYSQPRLLHF